MRIKTVILTLLCLFLLAGCTSSINLASEDAATLLIRRDGTIDELTIEDFDADYYTREALTSYVQKAVDDYNLAHPVPETESEKGDKKAPVYAVSLQDITVKDGQARMILSYLTAEDYSTFNETSLRFVPADDVVPALLTEDTLTDAKGNAANEDDAAAGGCVLILNEAKRVRTEGKIGFISTNVTLTDERLAESADGQRSVIIFK